MLMRAVVAALFVSAARATVDLINKIDIDHAEHYGKTFYYYQSVNMHCFKAVLGYSITIRVGTDTDLMPGDCEESDWQTTPSYVKQKEFKYVDMTSNDVAMYESVVPCEEDTSKNASAKMVVSYYSDRSDSEHDVSLALQEPVDCEYKLEMIVPETALEAASGQKTITVHGDPMMKLRNGTNMHLWLASDQLTPVLTWKNLNGSMTLLGKTFERSNFGNQWFKEFAVQQDGETVLTMAFVDDKLDILLGDKHIDASTITATRDADRAGVARSPVFSTSAKAVRLWHNASGVREQKTTGVHVQAAGLYFYVWWSAASKFSSKQQQRRYQHLNIAFDGGLPADAAGIFAELAGVKPLSAATSAMIMVRQHSSSVAHSLVPREE